VSFARAALQLGGLWALAFAQPLLDLLGRNAEFFVARGSTTGDILLLALGYTLLPPLIGAGAVWGLGRVRPALGWGAMLALVGLLAAALVLPPVGDALGGSAVAVPVALALGVGAAFLYARATALRSFLTVLGAAPVVVLLLFLVVSPVRGLLFPSDAGGAVAGPARSTTPIVHVVFDELPVSTLTDGDGRIDGALFPSFARLARESTWYRNATTVNDLTASAVPAQLTGEQPGANELPITRDHPRNLFTLFERSHRLTVVEPITGLCPERLCGTTRPGTGARLRSLGSDLELVVKHLLLPDDLRESLPAVDRVWEGFEAGATDGELTRGANLRRDVLARLARDDATAGFERAIVALDQPRSRPPLVFVHSTLPHGPWRYLPDGRQYDIEGRGYPGLGPEAWTGPQWQVDQSFQRHVLQAQYADRLLGRLLDALRPYDDAVLVVTADHGASFVTGQPRRPANAANIGAVAPVPFFVKRPGQRSGKVDDRAVRTIDVLPTIADAAGVRVPWKADGMPADRRPVDPDAEIDVSHAGEPALTEPLSAVLAKRDERDEAEVPLLREGVWAIGPRPDLLGRRVAPGTRRLTDPFVSGRADGVAPGTAIAVAVDGRVAATTRAYRDGGRTAYDALVPPPTDGASTVTAFEILPSGGLREL
jgi:sulfatase-like protein